MTTTRRRRDTRSVRFGPVTVGGGAPVSIQSMSTAPAGREDDVSPEIAALARAGCQIVRVAVKDAAEIEPFRRICEESPIPVVADVHFDHRLAVSAAGAGAAGLRINPGNIGSWRGVAAVLDAASAAGIPVRVGVNAGSLERDLRELAKNDPARAMVESAGRWREKIERAGFVDLVFSLKSSDAAVTIEANRRFAQDNDYPLHLGVTEAGPPLTGTAVSAAALAILLADGIGDTIRISLSGDPVREVVVAAALLRSLGLRPDLPRIVSCPTCGRAWIDVAAAAERVERELLGIGRPITVAVMGCEVNGPGEAREADIGVAGTRGGAVLFRRGRVIRTIEGDVVEELVREVMRFLGEGNASGDPRS